MGLLDFLKQRPSARPVQATLPTIEGTHSVTLANSPTVQRALAKAAARAGFVFPDKTGERFGYPVRVVIQIGTGEKGRPGVAFSLFGAYLDGWEDDGDGDADVRSLIRRIQATGGDKAEVLGTLYKGQGSKWRVRVKV